MAVGQRFRAPRWLRLDLHLRPGADLGPRLWTTVRETWHLGFTAFGGPPVLFKLVSSPAFLLCSTRPCAHSRPERCRSGFTERGVGPSDRSRRLLPKRTERQRDAKYLAWADDGRAVLRQVCGQAWVGRRTGGECYLDEREWGVFDMRRLMSYAVPGAVQRVPGPVRAGEH